jgi:DNA-directed RNA polymerase subunit beta
MPYTQDGKIIDIILNPLGIPSRMNIGQIFEVLLGLAGHYLKENYKIETFNKKDNKQISKVIIYNKLVETRKKTNKKWIFNPNYPGKTKIFNGLSGEIFKQPICIGYSYIIKLNHMVEDKITARTTGPYSNITKQPIKGRSRKGGQRFGEMEAWSIEGFNAAYTLQELLTLKSDDIFNRFKLLKSISKCNELPTPNIPECFKILIIEMQCLCIETNILINTNNNNI